MQEIPLRQAYQRVLVQDIYRAQNLERVVETGKLRLRDPVPVLGRGRGRVSGELRERQTMGNAAKPRTPTTAAPTPPELPPRPSATPQAIGKAAPR